ncbi:MAG: LysR substrate-binding domain-containing protein [Sphingobium sp.]|nr:LysR substrate-binding domain-containing protein [Sphingobium sp.]
MVAPSHLKSLQALEIAVRTGSFAAAAEELGITPAAVGQRVKVLEEYLGIALLVRGRAGIRPTQEALAALPQLHAAFQALEGAAAALDLQSAQEIHIAVVPDFADLWLKPRLASFLADHPQVRFCINGEGDAPMRLARVDVEIAFGPVAGKSDGDLLFHDLLLPIASPANVARTAAIPAAQRLDGFPLLHVDFYRDDPAALSWAYWCEKQGILRSGAERGVRFRRIADALDAVLAHAGISLCGIALFAEVLESGRIALPFPNARALPTEHGFVARYRADAGAPRILDRFRDWLSAEATGTRARLEHFSEMGNL